MREKSLMFLIPILFSMGCAATLRTPGSREDAATSTTLPKVTAVAAGVGHTCALLADGTVRCWGANVAGQLGGATVTESSPTPQVVTGISTAVAIAPGGAHTCVLLANRTVQCWGNNEEHQLGTGTPTRSSITPMPVSGISTATAIAAGWAHTCALLANRTVQCWGNNQEGQLGTGTPTRSSATPVPVAGISNAIAIAAGVTHTCALLADGAVFCWGTDSFGQPRGTAFSLRSPVPVRVSGISAATAIAAGRNHTCAVLADGTVKCWGSNLSGQLANAQIDFASATPVPVPGISTATAIAAGLFHTCTLLANGTVQCWGNNQEGQLGIGTPTRSSPTPVPVIGISTATAVAAGGAHTCALLANRSVLCWGGNLGGQLGTGTISEFSAIPAAAVGISEAPTVIVRETPTVQPPAVVARASPPPTPPAKGAPPVPVATKEMPAPSPPAKETATGPSTVFVARPSPTTPVPAKEPPTPPSSPGVTAGVSAAPRPPAKEAPVAAVPDKEVPGPTLTAKPAPAAPPAPVTSPVPARPPAIPPAPAATPAPAQAARWEATIAAGREAFQQGRYDEPEKLFVAALKEAEGFGPQDPRMAISLGSLAEVYRARGKYAEAEPLYQRSLTILEKARGPEHPDVATSLNNLALLQYNQGKYAAAEPHFKRALAIYEKARGPEHPDVATSLNNLAEVSRAQGKLAETERLYRRALTIYEKALGQDHPAVATSLNNLATFYRAQGKYVEAEPLLKRSLAIRERVLGPDHPSVATSLSNLAFLYHVQGKPAEAEPLLKRALAILERALGPEHPNVAGSLNGLAEVYRAQGKYAEAEPLYQRSLAIYEKTLGPEHPNVAGSLEDYAALLKGTRRDAEAEKLLARAGAIRAKHSQENPTQ